MTFEQTMQIALLTAGLTFIANFVFGFIKVKFNLFEEKTIFKRKYSYEQLQNLYLELYSIVAQSEYLRYFHNFDSEFKDLPFFEISQKRITTKISFSATQNATSEQSEKTIKDGVTEYNKEKIQELILNNAKYSSQKLLKLAVAHRYVARHYTDNTIEGELLNKYQIEELNTIAKIVITIVKETNQKLKDCNMDYNVDELNDGMLINGIID